MRFQGVLLFKFLYSGSISVFGSGHGIILYVTMARVGASFIRIIFHLISRVMVSVVIIVIFFFCISSSIGFPQPFCWANFCFGRHTLSPLYCSLGTRTVCGDEWLLLFILWYSIIGMQSSDNPLTSKLFLLLPAPVNLYNFAPPKLPLPPPNPSDMSRFVICLCCPQGKVCWS